MFAFLKVFAKVKYMCENKTKQSIKKVVNMGVYQRVGYFLSMNLVDLFYQTFK